MWEYLLEVYVVFAIITTIACEQEDFDALVVGLCWPIFVVIRAWHLARGD